MFSYHIQRWHEDDIIEDQKIKSPVPIDYLGYFYRLETDWTDLLIEKYDNQEKCIGHYAVSKGTKQKTNERKL